MNVLKRMAEAVRAPFIGAPKEYDLTAMIQYRRDKIRDRQWITHGKIMAIRFDVCAGAAYESIANAQHSEEKRLMVEWTQDTAPLLGNIRNGQFVLPLGIQAPPRMCLAGINQVVDPLHPPEYINQPWLDYADGYMQNARNAADWFAVIQPIICFVVLVQGCFILYKGHVDTASGTRPALLWNPNTKEAHILKGIILPEKVT